MSGDDLTPGHRAALGRIESALFDVDGPPTRVGRFEIVERVGSGGFGAVYSARDPELDRLVAVKVLHPDTADEARRLRREAQAMAGVVHPNVATVYDVGTTERDARTFIAMELVDGPTLREYVDSDSGTPAQRLELLMQVGHGLAAAHRAGVVHRDFKPDNVLLGSDGRPRVIDFGLARPAVTEDEADSNGADHPASHAVTGGPAGTPAYMAAELHAGSSADARSDQFAFCVTAFEVLTGERPFRGSTVAAVVLAIAQGTITAPATRTLPTRVQQALARGLAVDPAARHASMGALLRRLAPRQRRWWIAGAAGLAAVATATGLVAARDAEPSLRVLCADGDIEAAWTDRRPELAAALRASGDWPTVEATLERYADELAQGYADACAARDAPGGVRADEQMACLRGRRAALAAAVDALAAGIGLARASHLAAALPAVAGCAGAAAEYAADPRTAEIEGALQTETMFFSAGYFAQASAIIDELEVDLDGLRSPRLRARILVAGCQVAERLGDVERAEDRCQRGLDLAERSGLDLRAALAAVQLALIASERGDSGGAQTQIQRADSLLKRIDADPYVRARLSIARARVALAGGDASGSIDHFGRALAALDAAGSESVWHVDVLGGLGAVQLQVGMLDEAQRALTRARDLTVRFLGSDHPAVATILGNLAIVLQMRGQYREAAKLYRDQLAVERVRLGADHSDLAFTTLNAGIAAQLMGDHDAAEARYDDAFALAQGGPEGELLGAQVLINQADHLARLGRDDEASAAIAKARTTFEAKLPPGHPFGAYLYATVCAVEREGGRAARALKACRRALEIAQAPGGMGLAGVQLELGATHLALRETRSAIASLTAAASRAKDTGELGTHADALFWLARAHAELDVPDPTALELATRAAAVLPVDSDPVKRRAFEALIERLRPADHPR